MVPDAKCKLCQTGTRKCGLRGQEPCLTVGDLPQASNPRSITYITLLTRSSHIETHDIFFGQARVSMFGDPIQGVLVGNACL